MAWGFYYDFSSSVKPIKSGCALCREAAGVIPLGGGFQIYNTQNRDGSVRLWEVHELKDISKFVRDREPFLKGSKPFSNIGVLYSDYDMRNKSDSLFYSGGNDEVKGAVRLVLDSAYTCSILMDYMLTPEYLKNKNIIIAPEIKYMSDDIKNALFKFSEDGGNLIISGSESEKHRNISVPYKSRYINQYARASDTDNLIVKTKHGKGNIIRIHYNIFEIYCNSPDFYVRNMLADIINELNEDSFIEYKGQKFVDIVTAKKDDKLLINLTNTSGIYSENRLRVYDEIQPMTDMQIIVKCGKEPLSVMVQPENIIPDYKYDSQTQKLTVKIDKLDIHAVIVIE